MSQGVLVAGGAGFVGSHLCDALLARGESVVCVDNFYTGSRAAIAHLLGNPRFRLVVHDISRPLPADATHVDAIYNLACPASPPHYQRDPLYTMRTSVLGSLELLEVARRRGIPILQASTSEVYGDALEHPQVETYWGNVNPIGPRACYDEGKRAAETLFFDYRRTHGVAIKVARIFNTYGPRMAADDGRVVSNFIVQALRGEDLTVYGSGSQTRSFCYVSDLVGGLIRLMDSPEDVTGPVNLGNPDEYRVRDIAERIIAMTGARVGLRTLPLPVDDPRQRRPSIERAAALLGWRPETPLERGLSQTIAYFQETIGARAKPGLLVKG